MVEEKIRKLLSYISGVPSATLEGFGVQYLELHISYCSVSEIEKTLLQSTQELFREFNVHKERKTKTSLNRKKRMKIISDLQHELGETEKHYQYSLKKLRILRHERMNVTDEKTKKEDENDSKKKQMIHGQKEKLTKILGDSHKSEIEIEFLQKSRGQLLSTTSNLTKKMNEVEQEIKKKKSVDKKELQDHINLSKTEPRRLQLQEEVIRNFVTNVKEQIGNKNLEIVKLNGRIMGLVEDIREVREGVVRNENELSAKKHRLFQFRKDTDKIRKHGAELTEEFKIVDKRNFKLRQVMKNKKTTYYIELKNSKEKRKQYNAEKEKLNRIHRLIDNFESGIEKIEETQEILLEQRERSRTKYTKLKEKLNVMKLEVDMKIKKFLNHGTTKKGVDVSVLKSKKELEDCNFKCQEHKMEERKNKQLIFELTNMLNDTTKSISNQKQDFVTSLGNLKMKHFINKELKKNLNDLQNDIKHVISNYQQTKMERNKYAQQINDAQQNLIEFSKNKKILENECEILQRKSLEKEKEVQKGRRSLNYLISVQEKKKREVSKLNKKLEKGEKVLNEKLSCIEKLSKCIKEASEELKKLKEENCTKIVERNFNGVQLMDRNDELFILNEKLAFQTDILNEGNICLLRLNEQISVFRSQLQSLIRELIIANEKLPNIHSLIKEKETLILDLEQQKITNSKLCGYIENTENEERFHKINPLNLSKLVEVNEKNKDDMTFPVFKEEKLREKLENVKEKLNFKKDKLLEKQLILKELEKTTDKMRKLSIESRKFYLNLKLSQNLSNKRIQKFNRQLKALLAESSIWETKKIIFNIQNKKLKKHIADLEMKLEKDIPPAKKMYDMWEKERENLLKKKNIMEASRKRREMEDEHLTFATITRTTAKKRPNAYIPDADGVLALPKPYLIKPVAPRLSTIAQMRHFRKPKTPNVFV